MTPGQGPGLTVQGPGQREDSKDYLTLKYAAYEASIQRQRYCYVCLGYSKTHKCHVFLTVNRQTPLDFSYLDSVLLGRERSWLFRKTCIRCLICARGFFHFF